MSGRRGAPTAAVRLFGVVRTAWGVTLLVAPERVLCAIDGRVPSVESVPVARVLGGRQIVQGVATALLPTRRLLRWGAVVDVLHAASMAGLAAGSPRHRRVGLVSAGLTTAAAVTGGQLSRHG